ncbi:MAG: Multidrug-efflux transporter 1 regulator [Firmicutes bacterium ADurb.BinA052]|nr:MAG: Multidrug-efflux transporter 1 regulator [Firmicutes bacterium ADurb.BinA052]
MEFLSIGKMAALNHITVQALRHYDKIDLLRPLHVDEETGYRYYDIKQSAILDMIQYMKSLGMSLEQIREQFRKEDIEEIQDILRKQSRNIDNEIGRLHQMKRGVEACIRSYGRYLRMPDEGAITLETIPARKVFCYDGGINIYDHGLDTYEYILRELKKQVIIADLPMVYFCNVGSILRKEMIDAGKFESSEIFVFVDDDFEDQEGIEVIPGGNYVCTYFHSFWNERESARRLFHHIDEQGYQIIGDYVCEVVVELPIFDNNERNMYVRLQIPVDIPSVA